MTKYIRELEQTNDDLERAKRQVFHQRFLTNWQTLFYCFIYIPHLLKHKNSSFQDMHFSRVLILTL